MQNGKVVFGSPSSLNDGRRSTSERGWSDPETPSTGSLDHDIGVAIAADGEENVFSVLWVHNLETAGNFPSTSGWSRNCATKTVW